MPLEWSQSRYAATYAHKDIAFEFASWISPEFKLYSFTYATEADVLNVAMFGKTAKQWREINPGLDGNIRDYATLQQLIVLSNMESLNAEMIKSDISREDRLVELNRVAKEQMHSLIDSKGIKRLVNMNIRK